LQEKALFIGKFLWAWEFNMAKKVDSSLTNSKMEGAGFPYKNLTSSSMLDIKHTLSSQSR
jgi:hypothetical protein